MTKFPILITACILTAVSASSAPLHGQAPDSAGASCARHERVLVQGGSEQETEHALQRVGYCGTPVWGRAVAGAMSRTRTSHDMRELGRAWRSSQWLRDGSIYAVALAVAADRSAAAPARVFALRALLSIARPDVQAEYGDIIEPPNPATAKTVNRSCLVTRPYHEMPYQGSPVPAGARASIFAVSDAVAKDQAEPEIVRNAADCVAFYSGVPAR